MIRHYSVLLNYAWFLRVADLYVIMEKLCDLLSEQFPNVTAERLRVDDSKNENLNGKFTFSVRRDYNIDGRSVNMFMCYVSITDEWRTSIDDRYVVIAKVHGHVVSFKDFHPKNMTADLTKVVNDIIKYETQERWKEK